MTGPRQGPRPLPLHLASAATLWMSSRAALPLLSNGFLPWRPELAPAAGALRQLSDRARALSPPSLPPRRGRAAGALARGLDAAPRLCAGWGRAGAGGALAHQPRLYPRSRSG